MSMPLEYPQIFVTHHKIARVGGFAYLQLLLDAADERFLDRAAELAADVASGQ